MRRPDVFAVGSNPALTPVRLAHSLDEGITEDYVTHLVKDLVQYVNAMRERLAQRQLEYLDGEPVCDDVRDESETGRINSQR